MRKIIGWVFPALIVLGVIVGPSGIMVAAPKIAGIGNAMFAAGYLTPVFITKQIPLKQGLFIFMWGLTVWYFWYEGSVDGMMLLMVVPLCILSILLTKLSGVVIKAPIK